MCNLNLQRKKIQNTKREGEKKKPLGSCCHSPQNTKLVCLPVTKICIYNLIGLSWAVAQN